MRWCGNKRGGVKWAQSLFIRSSLRWGRQPPSLASGRDSAPRGEWGSFIMKKREGLGCARVGGRWHGEGGGLPRIGASSVVWGGMFGFLRLILAGKGLLSWKPSGLTSPAGCGRTGSQSSTVIYGLALSVCTLNLSVENKKVRGVRPPQNKTWHLPGSLGNNLDFLYLLISFWSGRWTNNFTLRNHWALPLGKQSGRTDGHYRWASGDSSRPRKMPQGPETSHNLPGLQFPREKAENSFLWSLSHRWVLRISGFMFVKRTL